MQAISSNYHLSLKSDNRYVERDLTSPKSRKDMMKYTSLSVRVWVPWLEILKKAVKNLQSKEPDLTIPEYVRSRLGPILARDAGLDRLPDFPPLNKRGRPTAARAAAELLGVPLEQWKKDLVEEAANAVLKKYGSSAPQSRTAVIRRTKVQ